MAMIEAVLMQENVFSNSASAHDLHDKSRFGEKKDGKIVYSLEEAMFLIDKGTMKLLNTLYKQMTKDQVLTKFSKLDKRFMIRYSVFRDLRKKGYIVKSALKFGSDFRVYEKGKSVGKSHSKWICHVSFESEKFDVSHFVAKHRVAHSTKKDLLIAVVDNESDVTYFESSWKKIT